MTRGRHSATPLRLTRRGRVMLRLVAGGTCLAVAVFGQPISVGFFTGVLWFGNLLSGA